VPTHQSAPSKATGRSTARPARRARWPPPCRRVPVCRGSATACPRCPVLAPGRPGRVRVGRRAHQRRAGSPVPGF
jgi:hypothetical protein